MSLFHLSQRFYFEAAHTLTREHEAEGSSRIHGHTYEAEVTIEGVPDPNNGMILDLAILRDEIRRIRELLDHRFLDDVEGLGPATLENLTVFIKEQMIVKVSTIKMIMVERRASGDKCTLYV